MEKLKKALIVWVSIYPPLTIILLAFDESLNTLPLASKTLVLTVILVPLMVYILIPFWTSVFNRMGTMKWSKSEVHASDTTKPGEN